jgi:polyferredoxin
MDPTAINPFSVLTFIVAPAIMTNASSVMTMGTSNRFARAVDRVRALSSQVENQQNADPEEKELRMRQLRASEKRTLMMLHALTAFYLAVGSFAAASLISLLGAVFYIGQLEGLRNAALVVAFIAGILGVASLVTGSAFLVGESRLTLRILKDETAYRLKRSMRAT